MRDLEGFAEKGCETCSIFCEGVSACGRSFMEQEPLYREWLSMSQLIIELRNKGSVVVEICPWDDEDTTYLSVEFYTSQVLPI
jgi:hypothetical protein